MTKVNRTHECQNRSPPRSSAIVSAAIAPPAPMATGTQPETLMAPSAVARIRASLVFMVGPLLGRQLPPCPGVCADRRNGDVMQTQYRCWKFGVSRDRFSSDPPLQPQKVAIFTGFPFMPTYPPATPRRDAISPTYPPPFPQGYQHLIPSKYSCCSAFFLSPPKVFAKVNSPQRETEAGTQRPLGAGAVGKGTCARNRLRRVRRVAIGRGASARWKVEVIRVGAAEQVAFG